jgi:signal transduction histidine kinase
VPYQQQPADENSGDLLAPVPVGETPTGSPEPDETRPAAPVEITLRDVAAVTHTLVARLTTQEALARALAQGARLLSAAHAVRLYAVQAGVPRALVRLGTVTPKARGNDLRPPATTEIIETLGLGAAVDHQVLDERRATQVGGTRCLPLLAADGTLLGALVVVGAEEAQVGTTQLVMIVADTLAALLMRRREELASEHAAQTVGALDALAQPGDIPAEHLEETRYQLLRMASGMLVELAHAQAGVVLVPVEGDRLGLLEDGAVSPMPFGAPATAQVLAAAQGARGLVDATPTTASLWDSLRPLRTWVEAHTGATVARLLLLPVTAGGELVAILGLALGAPAVPDPLWLPLARAVAGAVAAGVQALRLEERALREGRARDEFISLAAHELRSPLTSIKGYAQLLARQARKHTLPESMARSVEAIEQQSMRMSEMIGELLDASRIRRGVLDVIPGMTDLVSLVERLLERRGPMYPQHELVLESTVPSLVGGWETSRVEQIVRDLLDNAVRYSPEGGPVTLRISREGRMARLTVRDAGIGIAEADREHVFDYLFRAVAAEQRNLTGLGLGLFVSRAIAERMGGSLTLDWTTTAEPSGSQFSLRLPLD